MKLVTIRPDLFRSSGFLELPKAAKALGRTALHSVDWGACGRLDTVNYPEIEAMVNQCIELTGKAKADADGWMLWLYSRIIENHEALNLRWPYPVVRQGGKLFTRSVCGRLFGSVAIWRIEMAICALQANDAKGAMNEIALAGQAVHFGSTGEGHDDSRINHAEQRRKGASARWADDPTQTIKQQMRAEWERWQRDRALYKLPRDYRKKMLNTYPQAVDGTLRNWMSDWGKDASRS